MQNPLTSTITMRAVEVAEKHLGTDELARRIGAKVATVSAWRSGVEAIPGDKLIKLLAILEGIKPDWAKESDPGSGASSSAGSS